MEKNLMNNVIESATLVVISAGVGLIGKKVIQKSITADPSTNIMNTVQWVVVMLGAIYARDYLIKQKILPS